MHNHPRKPLTASRLIFKKLAHNKNTSKGSLTEEFKLDNFWEVFKPPKLYI